MPEDQMAAAISLAHDLVDLPDYDALWKDELAAFWGKYDVTATHQNIAVYTVTGIDICEASQQASVHGEQVFRKSVTDIEQEYEQLFESDTETQRTPVEASD